MAFYYPWTVGPTAIPSFSLSFAAMPKKNPRPLKARDSYIYIVINRLKEPALLVCMAD